MSNDFLINQSEFNNKQEEDNDFEDLSGRDFRLYDRIKFRIKQEILLRDDEINRLKRRLEKYQYMKVKSSDIARNKNLDKSKKNDIINNNEINSKALANLKNMIFVEKNKAEMKLTNASIEHSQKMTNLKKQFYDEIYQIKMQIHSDTSTFDEVDDEISKFTSSIRKLTRKRFQNNEYQHETADHTLKKARDFDMRLFYEEIRDNEKRSNELRKIIQKMSENSTKTSFKDSEDSLLDNNSLSFEEANDASRSNLVFEDLLNQVTEENKMDVLKLKKRISIEKKKIMVKKRKIEMAENRSMMTDTEIAAAIIAQDQIKQRKAKNNSIIETLEFLSNSAEGVREEMLERLKRENITIKREIARVDYVVYGKTGHCQNWKKLDDETLLRASLPLH